MARSGTKPGRGSYTCSKCGAVQDLKTRASILKQCKQWQRALSKEPCRPVSGSNSKISGDGFVGSTGGRPGHATQFLIDIRESIKAADSEPALGSEGLPVRAGPMAPTPRTRMPESVRLSGITLGSPRLRSDQLDRVETDPVRSLASLTTMIDTRLGSPG